jgi:hypothetical protein
MAQGKSIEETVSDLSDRAELVDLVYNYNLAIDRRDVELFRSLWAPGATWSFVGGAGTSVEGIDAILALCQIFWDTGESIHHGGTNVVVQVDGDRATGLANAIGRRVERDTGAVDGSIMAYDDSFVRIEGEWYFLSRVVHVSPSAVPFE